MTLIEQFQTVGSVSVGKINKIPIYFNEPVIDRITLLMKEQKLENIEVTSKFKIKASLEGKTIYYTRLFKAVKIKKNKRTSIVCFVLKNKR